VYQFEELKPEVGDFVKFKNFEGDNQRFNGKIGLIQKEMDHFGDGDSLEPRFKIATMNEENNFRQITTANFEIIKNCNSVHNRMEVGEMMWPKVKGMHAPCSHWVNDDRLTAMTMDFFNALHFYEQELEFAETMPKTNKYKEECVGEWNGRKFKLNENTNVAFLFFKKPCLYNGMIPGVWFPFVEDYCARVKDVFGWTKPKLFRHISHTDGNIAYGFMVCYDEDSKAEVNDWFDYAVPKDDIVRKNHRGDVGDHCCGMDINEMSIRGPFIIIRPTFRMTDRNQAGLIDTHLLRSVIDPNDKIAQRRYKESQKREKYISSHKIPEHDELWFGCQPFYHLNHQKAAYLRNRYILPDFLKKTREENMTKEWFEAKQMLSSSKTARNLSLEFGCRTGDCQSCADLQEFLKNETDTQKTSYKDVKAQMLKSLGVKVKKTKGGCCSNC